MIESHVVLLSYSEVDVKNLEVFKLIRRHSPQTSDTISRTVTMEDWWEIMRSI